MKWTHKLLACVSSLVLLYPNVASAYYWYGGQTYTTSYRPPAQVAPVTKSAASTPSTGTMTTVEQTLLTLTNQERAKYGVPALKADATLTNLARLKSADMVAKNYFSHNSPTYGSPAQMLAKYGVSYRYFAENIAQGGDAAGIHAMWMNSPGHRANILNRTVTHIGIGVKTGTYGLTATQLFIAR